MPLLETFSPLFDFVVSREERLSVKAFLRKALLEQSEDQLVGVHRCGLSQHLHGRRIEPDLVVFDSVAGNAHGQLEVLVLDGVVAAGEVLDLTLAQPLTHTGNIAEPCVGFGVSSRRHDRRYSVIKGLLLFKGFVECGVKADEDRPKILRTDNHCL